MEKIHAFISFDEVDARIRDLFIGQGKHPDTPWEIVDWSAHEAFDDNWKEQMRLRIRRSRVVVVLVGANTYRAEGALWEVQCGLKEGIPAFGVWIDKENLGPIPPGLSSNSVIEWTWAGVGEMIKKGNALCKKV